MKWKLENLTVSFTVMKGFKYLFFAFDKNNCM